mmetsp:Transcript_33325/g.55780  ORF Transcript_33325/g.55780 Transcript_33325/m.55780 type:complete len:237 (+) Transcript_33325:390-1100(+)
MCLAHFYELTRSLGHHLSQQPTAVVNLASFATVRQAKQTWTRVAQQGEPLIPTKHVFAKHLVRFQRKWISLHTVLLLCFLIGKNVAPRLVPKESFQTIGIFAILVQSPRLRRCCNFVIVFIFVIQRVLFRRNFVETVFFQQFCKFLGTFVLQNVKFLATFLCRSDDSTVRRSKDVVFARGNITEWNFILRWQHGTKDGLFDLVLCRILSPDRVSLEQDFHFCVGGFISQIVLDPIG